MLFTFVQQKSARMFGAKADFQEKDIPDLTGKVFVVTGGTAGLGLATVIALYKKNGTVVLSARNEARGKAAIEDIKSQVPESKGSVDFGVMDQTSLLSVEAFAKWLLEKKLAIDVLLLNAGIATVPMQLIHGVESHMFVNHLSHFYLVQSLLPSLKQANRPSRIIFVASDAHRYVSEKDFDWEKSFSQEYNGAMESFKQYGVSKLANIHCACYLAETLKDSQIYVNSIHPGAVRTNITSKVPFASTFAGKILLKGMNLFFSTAENGALTQLYVSVSSDIETQNVRGSYFVPVAKQTAPTTLAQNKDLWASLNALSEKWIEKVLKEESGKS